MGFPINRPALLLLFALLLYTVFRRITKKQTVLDTLPWVGLPGGPFAKIRAKLAVKNVRAVFVSSWELYSSQGKSFLFPTFLGRPLIVLPCAELQWIAEQPESTLSVHAELKESLALDHALLDPAILSSPIHETVIRGELTRTLGATIEPVRDELLHGLGALWGTSTRWHDVGVWDSLTQIIGRASSRIFVGPVLCRNEEFVKSTVDFAIAVIVSGNLLRPIPASLKSLFGSVLLALNRKHFRIAARHLVPLIEQRKADLTGAQEDKSVNHNEPGDLLQWNIVNSLNSQDCREWDSELIAKRCMATSFAAIHTTSTEATNVLFDIASSPPEMGVLDSLREEAIHVYDESGRLWTKASLAKLVRMDSVIRESLRLGALGAFGLVRKVVARGGLVSSTGVELPEGSNIAVHNVGIQMLDGHYENAAVWDPFRFSRMRGPPDGEDAGRDSCGKDVGDILRDRKMAAVSTAPDFLTFGHGKHACPGRFFAVQEIKLLLLAIILNFDIQHIQHRPQNVWLNNNQTPPTEAKLAVRKLERPLLE